MAPALPFARSASDWIRWPMGAIVVPLGLWVAAFCIYLWPEWSNNPDLSHGLFAPVIFALLLWEGTRGGTQRWIHSPLLVRVGVVGGGIGAVLLFVIAGLLAASVGWSHSVVSFVLAGALVAILTAGLFMLASASVRAVPFNWPVLAAIGLWLLATPLPTGTYARLTLALQSAVTSGVLNALHVLGVPARQMGNIIELANTTVGVEDACSGIRSLLSCLYAGIFFSAWLVRSPAKRVVLIVIAPVLAVVMNYLRSLGLTLMANADIDIGGFWHDATGYAILGLTAAALAAVAAAFSSGAATVTPTSPLPIPAPRAPLILGFLTTIGTVLALGLFFYSFARPQNIANAAALPMSVEAILPTESPDWKIVTAEDLYRFAGILQTTHLAERNYYRVVGGQTIQLNAYVAHWEPGRASVSQVASHTPDACWPGNGWDVKPNPEPKAILALGNHTLPLAEHRLFQRGPMPQHVWFWHIYDGQVINYQDPYSIPALLEIALRYGFRRNGAQSFVRFSSNRPWEDFKDDPLVHEIFENLRQIGLKK
ncbi:MAG: exosortase/archaeosortase family protein [Candidatus Didemnitutus sp.]|nr:exosortase/archaeosortase family protein [Candidatus Didemnitutus sp.]